MGLMDSIFGGGTSINLVLDRPTGSPGGVVGGKVSLTGGKKPMKLTALRVHMIYVSVQSSSDGGLPKIDTRIVGEQTVAAAIDLPPGSAHEFTFRITVPGDTQPSAHNVSYKVQAVADIPGVKDPSMDVDFRVLPADKDQHRSLPLQFVYARFPGLQARDEPSLCDALQQLFLECYFNGGQYMEAEPLLAHYMRTGTVTVRRSALQAWANLVDNRVQPQHLQSLYGIANTPGLDQDTFDEVIRAACKFAEEGALPMVQQLATYQDARVRRVTADSLRFHASAKFQGKRELLIQFVQDPDPGVRAAGVGALAEYNDDAQVVYGIANLTERETSAEVLSAIVRALAFAHYNGHGDLTFAVYEKLLSSPHESVREAIAESLSNQPPAALQRIWAIAQRLLQDASVSVRKAMAFQFVNMERMPQLLPLAQHAAENDPSEEVRNDALRSLGRLMPPNALMAYYQQRLARATTEEVLWAVISGLRDHHQNPEAQAMLTRLGQHPNHDIANAAREAMSG